MTKVAYSILASNFLEIKEDVLKMEQAGVDLLHLDIMDGCFVDNITFGSQLVQNIKEETRLPLDCHLMVEKPEKIINQLIEIEVDMISIHVESQAEIQRCIKTIKEADIKVGLVLNPNTSAKVIEPYLSKVDFVLQMSVYPGYGGQKFMSSTMENVKWLNSYRKKHNLTYDIEVDGGVDRHTSTECIESGADILVSGSYLQKSIYLEHALHSLKK